MGAPTPSESRRWADSPVGKTGRSASSTACDRTPAANVAFIFHAAHPVVILSSFSEALLVSESQDLFPITVGMTCAQVRKKLARLFDDELVFRYVWNTSSFAGWGIRVFCGPPSCPLGVRARESAESGRVGLTIAGTSGKGAGQGAKRDGVSVSLVTHHLFPHGDRLLWHHQRAVLRGDVLRVRLRRCLRRRRTRS